MLLNESKPNDGIQKPMMKKPVYRSRREKVEAGLKEDEYVFDVTEMGTELIQERTALGMHPVCARCGARLEYALSPEETKKNGTCPGVRCPRNLSHCEIIVDFPNRGVSEW